MIQKMNQQNRPNDLCTNCRRIFFCKVFYLVDDVLILALGLEMHLDAKESADDATNTTAPEESVVKISSLNLIVLVEEPAHP